MRDEELKRVIAIALLYSSLEEIKRHFSMKQLEKAKKAVQSLIARELRREASQRGIERIIKLEIKEVENLLKRIGVAEREIRDVVASLTQELLLGVKHSESKVTLFFSILKTALQKKRRRKMVELIKRAIPFPGLVPKNLEKVLKLYAEYLEKGRVRAIALPVPSFGRKRIAGADYTLRALYFDKYPQNSVLLVAKDTSVGEIAKETFGRWILDAIKLKERLKGMLSGEIMKRIRERLGFEISPEEIVECIYESLSERLAFLVSGDENLLKMNRAAHDIAQISIKVIEESLGA